MKLLLAGAPGAVGSCVLSQALKDDRVTEIVALTRRSIEPARRLSNIPAAFDHLPADADFWTCDAAITTLGTTQKQAGSRERFYAIDHGYNVTFARLAHRNGVKRFALNSSLGANSSSSVYYLRIKGDIERDVATLLLEGAINGPPGTRITYTGE